MRTVLPVEIGRAFLLLKARLDGRLAIDAPIEQPLDVPKSALELPPTL
jgi:hypothetical protein